MQIKRIKIVIKKDGKSISGHFHETSKREIGGLRARVKRELKSDGWEVSFSEVEDIDLPTDQGSILTYLNKMSLPKELRIASIGRYSP